MDFQKIFQDFNPAKFLVHMCLLALSCLLALRLDGTIEWSYWAVFLPLWLWKAVVISGVITAVFKWIRNPDYRLEVNSLVHFKALLVCGVLHVVLLMFELLLCDQLERAGGSQHRWLFVFVPLVCISLVCIGLVVWAIKNQRSFEMELFLATNALQFIFLALQLDGYIQWSWKIVFIPLWVVMCVALIGVLYVVILALILLCSSEVVREQRAGSVHSACGYTITVIPLLVFEVLLIHKLDAEMELSYTIVVAPFLFALIALAAMSFCAKPANPWWFGIRKDFSLWLLSRCPLLQEYGNVSYKRPQPSDPPCPARNRPKRHTNSEKQTPVPIVSIEMPD